MVLGSEHLPAPGSPLFSRPMLFVGNHQKMGFYDTPLLVYELYVRGYRWVRHRSGRAVQVGYGIGSGLPYMRGPGSTA